MISTSRRAERAREIVRGKADAELEPRQAEVRADLRRQPRIGRGQRRPHALVQPAEDHQVGLLQPRFEQAPDEDARMAAIGRPDGLRVEQLAQQRHGVVGARRSAGALRRCLQLARAVRAAMRPSGPRQAAIAGQRAARLRQAPAAKRASEIGSRKQPIERASRGAERACHSPAALSPKCAVEAGEPGRRPRAAQLEVERAHRLEPGEAAPRPRRRPADA